MTLHIIRQAGDAQAVRTAEQQAAGGRHVALLLLQDAARAGVKSHLPTFVCADDLPASGQSPCERVDYDRIAQLIDEAEKVVCW